MQSASQPSARHEPSVLASEAGFSLVEIITASFVLVVGMLAVLALMTSSLAKTSANTGRVGATNVARELIEATRGLDYDDMTTASCARGCRRAGSARARHGRSSAAASCTR